MSSFQVSTYCSPYARHPVIISQPKFWLHCWLQTSSWIFSAPMQHPSCRVLSRHMTCAPKFMQSPDTVISHRAAFSLGSTRSQPCSSICMICMQGKEKRHEKKPSFHWLLMRSRDFGCMSRISIRSLSLYRTCSLQSRRLSSKEVKQLVKLR